MNIDIAGLNWFAIIVAALVTFFIGGAWYTALFGKIWLAGSRYTEEQMAKMHSERPNINRLSSLDYARLCSNSER